jgi:hypothetical protein
VVVGPARETAEADTPRAGLTLSGAHPMTKERKSNKEAKKKADLTLKEKRNAKKDKQESKTLLGTVKGGVL